MFMCCKRVALKFTRVLPLVYWFRLWLCLSKYKDEQSLQSMLQMTKTGVTSTRETGARETQGSTSCVTSIGPSTPQALHGRPKSLHQANHHAAPWGTKQVTYNTTKWTDTQQQTKPS
eukprot:4081604-Amphidinium_carterae.1